MDYISSCHLKFPSPRVSLVYLLYQPVMATNYSTNQIKSSHLESLCRPLTHQLDHIETAWMENVLWGFPLEDFGKCLDSRQTTSLPHAFHTTRCSFHLPEYFQYLQACIRPWHPSISLFLFSNEHTQVRVSDIKLTDVLAIWERHTVTLWQKKFAHNNLFQFPTRSPFYCHL